MSSDACERFVRNCKEHGLCTETGDFKRGNKAFDRKLKAVRDLREMPDRGEDILSSLLGDDDEWVKMSAATYLLPLRENAAIAILEPIAAGPRRHLNFVAEMVMKEWRAGRLKLP